MVELSAFWAGAAYADAGEALATFLGEGWSGDWRSALEGVTVDAVAKHPHVELSRWQEKVWREAEPLLVPEEALIRGDPAYPERLAAVHDAPPVLFVSGAVEALHADRVAAVVGTRSCTPAGAAVARDLASQLAGLDVVVVSGLARGIDAEAHRAAVRHGRTVAVLGHGLGTTAPRGHEHLRQQIIDSGGAVVSGWPADVRPERWTFPRRNRWIAGLSDHVVVVQAAQRSGALITGREGLSIDRPVHAVPGRLGEGHEGCHLLVAEGAQLVGSLEGLVSTLSGRSVRPLREGWLSSLLRGRSVDDVARERGVSVSELLVDLGRLEQRGVVVREAGGRYGPGTELTWQ